MGSTKDRIELCLRWAAAGVCLGVGLIGLLHDLPLRTLLWDSNWWGWAAELLRFSWQEWVTSTSVDRFINWTGRFFGLILFLTGLQILFWQQWVERFGIRRVPIVFAFFILLLQHFLIWKDHFWNLGHLLELSLQTSALLIWLFYLYLEIKLPGFKDAREQVIVTRAYWWGVRLLTAATFVGHGLYAVGYHPVPANFVMMTQSGLGVGEENARQLLWMVGWLDFLAALLLVLPWRKSQLLALCWIIPWAILTSLARLWSYGGLVPFDTLLTQWAPEVIRRLPHILVPVALFLQLFWARPQVQGLGTRS
ncbi:MAG: hypothetical protein AAGA31_14145 [Bacteroidota bacterium]